jgi:hypothetical protein
MTRQQQLIALHAHLCEWTTPTGKKCGAFYDRFKIMGMADLQLHEMQALFIELQNMGLITEYTHLPGSKYIPDRWTCKVIKREFPH